MGSKLKFGLLLPHFCEHASVEACIKGAQLAESLGFDSVWVRDHIVFTPHASDGQDKTHIEGLQILAAVGAVTKRLTLGTAMAIGHRHPIHLAQCFAALSAISQGQVILGLGLGGFPHEFAAVGRPAAIEGRAEVARANVEICRRLWSGEKLSFHNDYFAFTDVALNPLPVRAIPIWIGGGTPASCRRAVSWGDGWLPARITLATFQKRMEYLTELCEQAQRPRINTAVMPFTTVARSEKTALKFVDISKLVDESHNFSTWVKPPSGKFSTLDDIEGVILYGSPEQVAEQARAYIAAGADHVIFDLRLRFTDWYEQIEILGKEVIPLVQH